jgi:hypothetical protein
MLQMISDRLAPHLISDRLGEGPRSPSAHATCPHSGKQRASPPIVMIERFLSVS